ncbi:sensor histidine kinase [Lutibacter sp.]
MHKLVTYLICCFSFLVSAQNTSKIYKDIQVYTVQTKDSVPVEQIVEKLNNNMFASETNSKIYKNLADKTWWFHLKLPINNQEKYLSIANSYLSYGKAYLLKNDSIYPLHQVSYYKEQPYKFIYYRHPTWKIPANLPSHASVLLELQNNGGRSRLEFHLDDKNTFLKRIETEYLFFGAFVMFLLSMSLILVFFSILKKEYVVLFYAGYILLTIIEFLAGKGVGIQFIWGDNTFLTHNIRSFSQTVGALLMGLFYLNFYSFTKAQSVNKNIFKYGIYAIIPLIFLYVFKLFFGGLETLYLYVWIILRLIIFGWLLNHIYLAFKKQIPAYLVVAFILPIATISTHQSINPSVHTSPLLLFLLNNMYYFALIVEILLFTRYIFDSVIQSQLKYEKLKKISDDLKYQFHNKVFQVQQKERNRLVSDVHDSFGGYLEALKLRLLHPENNNPNQIKTILEAFYKDYRYLLNSLHTPTINASNFTETLLDFCNKLNQISNNIISADVHLNEGVLSQEKCEHLYRIISELLTNAIKYAEASKIELSMKQNSNNKIKLQVKDNGIGFDINKIRKNAFGLENIKKRVALLFGKISIDTQLNKGTCITVTV